MEEGSAMIDSPIHYEEVAPMPNEEQRRLFSLKQELSFRMLELHGWCSFEKACFLVDLIAKTKPHVIVEIGVWGGKSLIPMAYALRNNNQGTIFGIDPWLSQESTQWTLDEANRNFWDHANHEWVYQHLIEKIAQFGVAPQIQLLRCTSEAAEPIQRIDILHIDGNHSDPTSYLDVTKWVPLVNSGGWIIFDDMTWSENGMGTTARAARWLDEHCHKFAEFTDVCTWGVWVKP
jgi:predicted O-methyltransferase YrrM